MSILKPAYEFIYVVVNSLLYCFIARNEWSFQFSCTVMKDPLTYLVYSIDNLFTKANSKFSFMIPDGYLSFTMLGIETPINFPRVEP